MITCYLDSQDYSSLTDPRARTADRIEIRNTLHELARSKRVTFSVSATAVCEGVVLTPNAAHLAELKAEFLCELCEFFGSNALVSFGRLIQAEVVALAGRCERPIDMFDPQGMWFPRIPVEMQEHMIRSREA